MSSISRVFKELAEKKEAAFMPYVACGDPNSEFTVELANTLIRNGADMLEFGIPFSDPIADGPTIQNASARALNSGMNPLLAFEVAKKIRKQNPKTPIVVMTYYNLVMHNGVALFISKMKEAGLDGLIVPDVPIEESTELELISRTNNLDFIHLITPRTEDSRIKQIVSRSSGFVYLVSVEGTTGARENIQTSALDLIRRVKSLSHGTIPLAMGFGISKPDHVRAIVQAGADGVIIASRIIDMYSKEISKPGSALQEIANFARNMKAACLRPV